MFTPGPCRFPPPFSSSQEETVNPFLALAADLEKFGKKKNPDSVHAAKICRDSVELYCSLIVESCVFFNVLAPRKFNYWK